MLVSDTQELEKWEEMVVNLLRVTAWAFMY